MEDFSVIELKEKFRLFVSDCQSYAEFENKITASNTEIADKRDAKQKSNISLRSTGDHFEIYVYLMMILDPKYKARFDKIYMCKTVPDYVRVKHNIHQRDKGCDFIAIKGNECCIIQVKFLSNKERPTLFSGLATFLATAFLTDSKCILITNCNVVCQEVQNPKCENIYGQKFRKDAVEYFDKIKTYVNTTTTNPLAAFAKLNIGTKKTQTDTQIDTQIDPQIINESIDMLITSDISLDSNIPLIANLVANLISIMGYEKIAVFHNQNKFDRDLYSDLVRSIVKSTGFPVVSFYDMKVKFNDKEIDDKTIDMILKQNVIVLFTVSGLDKLEKTQVIFDLCLRKGEDTYVGLSNSSRNIYLT